MFLHPSGELFTGGVIPTVKWAGKPDRRGDRDFRILLVDKITIAIAECIYRDCDLHVGVAFLVFLVIIEGVSVVLAFDFVFGDVCIRGLQKMKLMASLSFIVMNGMALAAVSRKLETNETSLKKSLLK